MIDEHLGRPLKRSERRLKIEQLFLHDPAVHAMLNQVAAGHLSWEDAMEELVLVLVGDKKILLERLTKTYAEGLPPIYVSCPKLER